MEYVFSYMNFAFGGALLLYALVLRLTLDVKLIPRADSAEIRNPRKYAKKFANLIVLISLAFITGGWVALYAGPVVGAAALAAALAAAIWLCVRLWRKK